jgi:hypothetical protein
MGMVSDKEDKQDTLLHAKYRKRNISCEMSMVFYSHQESNLATL